MPAAVDARARLRRCSGERDQQVALAQRHAVRIVDADQAAGPQHGDGHLSAGDPGRASDLHVADLALDEHQAVRGVEQVLDDPRRIGMTTGHAEESARRL